MTNWEQEVEEAKLRFLRDSLLILLAIYEEHPKLNTLPKDYATRKARLNRQILNLQTQIKRKPRTTIPSTGTRHYLEHGLGTETIFQGNKKLAIEVKPNPYQRDFPPEDKYTVYFIKGTTHFPENRETCKYEVKTLDELISLL